MNPGRRRVRIEAKDEVVTRLGRSPDLADAVMMAWWNDPSARRQSPFFAVAGQRAGVV